MIKNHQAFLKLVLQYVVNPNTWDPKCNDLLQRTNLGAGTTCRTAGVEWRLQEDRGAQQCSTAV